MSQPSRNRGADCKLIDAGDVRKHFEVGKNMARAAKYRDLLFWNNCWDVAVVDW